jgi:uncharacterized RDD family membrane protein YckC
MTEQPTPGWYPDPRDSRQVRWWDGLAWSERVHAHPDAGPPTEAMSVTAGGLATAHMATAVLEPAFGPVETSVSPTLPTYGVPANFGQRLAARLLDGLICSAPVIPLYAVLFGAIAAFGSPNGALYALLLGPLVVALGDAIITQVYFQFCETRGCRTVGRAVAGIRLININDANERGDHVGGGQAFGRRIVSGFGDMLFGLNSLSLLWQPQKRTWGDLVSGTAVVQARVSDGPKRGLVAGAIATAIVAVGVVGSVGAFASAGDPTFDSAPDSTVDSSSDSQFGSTGSGWNGGQSTSAVDPSNSRQVAVGASVPATAPGGMDASGSPTSYGAENLLDDEATTTWRMPGDGSAHEIVISLDGPRTITSVGLIPGYAKVDPSNGIDRFTQERRIVRVTWIFPSGFTYVQAFDPTDASMQSARFDTPQAADSVTLHIDETTAPGDPNFDYTAISELLVLGQ